MHTYIHTNICIYIFYLINLFFDDDLQMTTLFMRAWTPHYPLASWAKPLLLTCRPFRGIFSDCIPAWLMLLCLKENDILTALHSQHNSSARSSRFHTRYVCQRWQNQSYSRANVRTERAIFMLLFILHNTGINSKIQFKHK